MEYVKNMIKMAELKEKSKSGNSKSNAFMFENRKEEKKNTCYVCGGFGHIQYDYPKKVNAERNSWNSGTPQRGSVGKHETSHQRGTSSNRRGRSSYR